MSNYYPELKGVLREQYALYPEMQPIDIVKLIYQSEFAGGHMITDEQASLQRLEEEWASLKLTGEQAPPVFEELSNGLCRLNLIPILNSGVSPATVNRIFVLSANGHQGSLENFERKLAAFRQWCVEGMFPWASIELDAYLIDYRAKGYPAVSHSESYRLAYSPAYRVVSSKFRPCFALLGQIDKLIMRHPTVNVAIDGHSGSGKTSLADLLAEIYDCTVISMDHFFLPFPLRTEARLSEAGGNIDYDRFIEEVLAGLESNQAFSYGIYDCAQGKIIKQAYVPRKQLNIIEGVYSLHPKFSKHYQLQVFLQIDSQTQSVRILQRNGAALHQRFLQEWIPLEKLYFTTYNIAERAELILSLS